jgi:hypothetical protein
MKNLNMTDEQKLRVLNAIMWIQTCVYACDSVEDIEWFMARRVKYLAKNLVETSLRDHNHIIKALWEDEGTQMTMVTNEMDTFCQLVASIDYFRIPELNHLLSLYKQGKLDHLFTKPQDDGEERQAEGGV